MTDIPQTHRLKTTLATMKSAQAKSVNMCIWKSDIEAVEEALTFIEAMRAVPAISSNNGCLSAEDREDLDQVYIAHLKKEIERLRNPPMTSNK